MRVHTIIQNAYFVLRHAVVGHDVLFHNLRDSNDFLKPLSAKLPLLHREQASMIDARRLPNTSSGSACSSHLQQKRSVRAPAAAYNICRK